LGSAVLLSRPFLDVSLALLGPLAQVEKGLPGFGILQPQLLHQVTQL
jgi:hypothetical protein